MANELLPSVLTLDKGLDLSSSKITAPPGTLLSCENYEITDVAGLSRVDGYEPYDAQTSPGLTSLYVFTVFGSTAGITAGDLLVSAPYIGNKVIGEVVSVDSSSLISVMVSNIDVLKQVMVFSLLNKSTGGTTGSYSTTAVLSASDFYTTEATLFTAITTAATFLRARITTLNEVVVGLHRFKDVQYAVAPCLELRVNPTNDPSGTPVFSGAWTISGGVNTVGALVSIGTITALIISPLTVGSFDATLGYRPGTMLVAPISGNWVNAVGPLTGPTTAAATFIYVNRAISNGSVGTLWRTETAQQQLDRGATYIADGWQPVYTGWNFKINNGTYSSASIPKRERINAVAPLTTATYYLYNGSTLYSCELTSYFIETGGFLTNNAVADIQIMNLTKISGTDTTINNTFDLHSANPPLAGNKIGDLTNNLTYNSLSLLTDSDTPTPSKYEFITANFYADESWDAMYGVNGLERAFYYDGTLFARIFTQTDPTKDLPRHLAYFSSHLALGFKPGSVQISVIGDPWNFDGSLGASEWGVGDRVTGLLPLNGTTLGVFCQQSISAINGSTIDNFSMSVLSPHTGCIEYSLVNMGEPVFCNHSGIVTLSQSQKYGDFVGVPLSASISSWVRPRLSLNSAKRAASYGLIGAIPVRAKNQYRLFFKDGYTLTMTVLPGEEVEAQFTTQRLTVLDNTVTPQSHYLTPRCWSSVIDSTGEEHLHFVYFDLINSTRASYVFKLDEGWGFAGVPVNCFLETNWVLGQSPVEFFNIQKARLYGVTQGRASLKILASGIQDIYESAYNVQDEEYIDLPRTPIKFVSTGYPSTNIASLAARGLGIQLKIQNRTVANPEPPHVVQALVLQVTPTGARDS